MPDPADRVADALAAAWGAQAARSGFAWGTVRSVNPDGETLSVETGEGYRVNVRPAKSYTNRAEGDRVLVALTDAAPMVIAAFGAESPTATVDTISDSAPPGGQGWEEIEKVYAKPGFRWYKRLVAAPPPSGFTLTQAATALTTYRGGAVIASGKAEQGDYSGRGLCTGLATFPSWAALSGKTATGGVLRIHRSGSGHGFTYGPVTATAWLVSATGSPPSPPALGSVSTLVSAALNEGGEVALTAGQAQLFCAGTVTAVAFYSSNRLDNIEIDSVELTINA